MIALEVLHEMEERDAGKLLTVYDELIDTLAMLVEAPHELNSKPKDLLYYSEKIVGKFVFHGLSLHQLLYGVPYKSRYWEGEGNRVDVHSADLLLRTQIETRLVFGLLYEVGRDRDEREFIFSCWMYSSLLSRQSSPITGEYARKQKLKDEEALGLLRKKILNLSTSQKVLKEQQVQRVLIGKDPYRGRLFSWKEIAERLGYVGIVGFEDIYGLLSRGAHTDGLSILFFKDANPEMTNERRCFLLNHACMWASDFLLAWVRLHPAAELKWNMIDQRLQERVRVYARALRR